MPVTHCLIIQQLSLSGTVALLRSCSLEYTIFHCFILLLEFYLASALINQMLKHPDTFTFAVS